MTRHISVNCLGKHVELKLGLTDCKAYIPYLLRNLTAIADFAVLLFLLQVSLFAASHLPTSFEALVSLNFQLPSTPVQLPSVVQWQVQSGHRQLQYETYISCQIPTSDRSRCFSWYLRLLSSSSARLRRETSFSSNNLTSATCSEVETTEACVPWSVQLVKIHKQGC